MVVNTVVNTDVDNDVIMDTINLKEKVTEIQSQDEETCDNSKKDFNFKISKTKKRGRKPKVETPIKVEIPDLNNSLRRSERKRKPVNPFNIVFTPLSSKKNKVNDSQNENIDMKEVERKKIKNNNKRGRPKKSKKHSPDKDFKLKKQLKKSLKDKMKSSKKHKQKQKQKQPWEQGESSEEHIEELDEEDLYNHEESDISPNLKDEVIWNDKPESDFDPDNLSISSDEEMLIARGKNYFRQKKRLIKLEQKEIVDDKPCQICLGVTLPEMILLCDACDMGHHAMCLKPSLMLIPEGEWFCPKCQHKKLVSNLSDKISELEKTCAKNIAKIRMQERLNFVNISMTNILSSNRNIKPRQKSSNESNNDSLSPSYTSSSESSQGSSSSRSSESQHGRYKFRESSRKENTKYNFEEIDKIFDNALENDEKYQMMKKKQKRNEDDSEESAPEYDYSGIEPRKKSSGKDMSNILQAEEEDKPQLRRPSKRKRSKFETDDEEFEDDAKDQDFRLSSEQSCSDMEEDDKTSQNDESDSDDHQWRSRTRRSTRKGHRRKEKKGRKKPRVDFQDAINRPRRNAAKKVNYLEMLGEEDKDVDAQSSDHGSDYDDASKPPPVLSRRKSKSFTLRRKISDSEYEESNDDSGSTEKLQSIKSKNRRKSCLDSDTDTEREDNKLIIEESQEEVESESEVSRKDVKKIVPEVKNVSEVKNESEVKNVPEVKSVAKVEIRVCTLSHMNPMRAKDDQDIDVENEVESETECDNESVIKVDCVVSETLS